MTDAPRRHFSAGDTRTSASGQYTYTCVIGEPDAIGQTVWMIERKDRPGLQQYIIVDWRPE